MPCLRFLPIFVAAIAVSAPLFAQNDKQVLGDAVLTPSEIANGATVLYLIRFQNVGHDTVQQIVVGDTLDPRLDPGTFTMLSASHDYQLLGEGGSLIRWYFEDIELPDSASGGPNSVGYILFSVQPQPFAAPGQTIVNRACTKFDDSYTICTNEAIVRVDDNSDIGEIPGEGDVGYVVPNPNYGQFEVRLPEAQTVSATDAAQWWITDMGGRTVWDGTAENAAIADNQILLEKPAPGLYLLWIKSKKQIQVERFTVIR